MTVVGSLQRFPALRRLVSYVGVQRADAKKAPPNSACP
ncbi:hypothetical protein ABIA32_003161 [Streptacidiphilus sp. MAP12-20]